MFGRKPILDGVSSNDLLVALTLALLGLVGWLPTLLVGEGANSPTNLMAWYALAGPAIGSLGGGRRLRFWPLGLVAPGLWMALYSFAAASELYSAPTPFYAALAWTGLFAAGWAIGRACPPSNVGGQTNWSVTGTLLVFGALFTKLTSVVAVLDGGGSQTLMALAFDASPVTFVMECAGLDWMRHESVYDLVGSLPPDVRTPYRGMLAGPLVLLLGWVLNLAAERLSRGRAATELEAESPVGS